MFRTPAQLAVDNLESDLGPIYGDAKATPTTDGPVADRDEPEGTALPSGLARLFMLAGNATFTVVSRKTGKRFTFRMRRPTEESNREFASRMAGRPNSTTRKPIFLSVLNGPDNESSYAYLGTVWENAQGYEYAVGRKSTISADAPSQLAAAWLTKCLVNPDRLAEQADVYHAGKCGRCGRKLTVPSSIQSGIGPECATKL